MIWYKDQETVLDFEDALIEAGEFEDPSELSTFHRHPQRWSVEFKMWDTLERPLTDEEESWDEFIAFLDSRTEE